MRAIENSGGGLAQSAGFAVLSELEKLRSSGHLGTGFLRPGEGALLYVAMPGRPANTVPDDLYVQVTCRDTREYAHAWSAAGQHIVFRSRVLRRPRYLGADPMFAEMFPQADFAGTTAVSYWIADKPLTNSDAPDKDDGV